MKTRGHRTQQRPTRTAGAFPVTQLCEICCLVLCRILVPKLADKVDFPS
jgi:hypothetical protein